MRSKRRVALFLGYRGTAYKGIQKTQVPMESVEGVVEDALYRAGYISERNMGSLEKIGWGRSSRTDKGVHAAGNIISAKLMCDLGAEDPYRQIMEDTNPLLPQDIRVLGAVRVRKNFNPRRCQTFRMYEYLMPNWFIPDEEVLSEIEALFKGKHNFHNFAAGSSNKARPSFASQHHDMMQDTVFDTFQSQVLQYKYDPFKNRTIRSISLDKVQLAYREEPVFKLSICGESFLYHQIRKILASIYLMAHHKLSCDVVRIALQSPFHIPIPLAPAFPLQLVYTQESFYDWRKEKDEFDELPSYVMDNVNAYKESLYQTVVEDDFDARFKEWESTILEHERTDIDEALLKRRWAEVQSIPGSREKTLQLFKLWKAQME